MIDKIFACPIRKYHIDNQQDQIEWAESEYNHSKFIQMSQMMRQYLSLRLIGRILRSAAPSKRISVRTN